jgi:hypothetical protein
MHPSRPVQIASADELEHLCERAHCPGCLRRGAGEVVHETKRIVCKHCGQFIRSYAFMSEPKIVRFIVVLEPRDPTSSIRALRFFLKKAWRDFGLKCIDIREET